MKTSLSYARPWAKDNEGGYFLDYARVSSKENLKPDYCIPEEVHSKYIPVRWFVRKVFPYYLCPYPQRCFNIQLSKRDLTSQNFGGQSLSACWCIKYTLEIQYLWHTSGNKKAEG